MYCFAEAHLPTCQKITKTIRFMLKDNFFFLSNYEYEIKQEDKKTIQNIMKQK